MTYINSLLIRELVLKGIDRYLVLFKAHDNIKTTINFQQEGIN